MPVRVDFSGFTSTIYQVYGITLPRDAGPQAADSQGRPVDKSAFQPGDLLFYSHGSRDPDNPDAIYHVAMYSGNGDMIEAFDSATPVRITRFDWTQTTGARAATSTNRGDREHVRVGDQLEADWARVSRRP